LKKSILNFPTTNTFNEHLSDEEVNDYDLDECSDDIYKKQD